MGRSERARFAHRIRLVKYDGPEPPMCVWKIDELEGLNRIIPYRPSILKNSEKQKVKHKDRFENFML